MIQRNLLRSSRTICSLARPLRVSPLTQVQSPYIRVAAAQPFGRLPTRWYSESTEAAKKDAAEEGKSSQPDAGAKITESGSTEIDSLKKQLETAKQELEKKSKETLDWKDKYLRSLAEFRNLQERTKREVQSAKDYALQGFAKDLIDSVDNLDRALTTVPTDKLSSGDAANQELVNLHSGIKMTENILIQTLKKHGLERFDPSEQGDKFNPNMHEAVFQTPMPDKEDGTVFHTTQKGFVLNGRVLRAAKVGVVKNS